MFKIKKILRGKDMESNKTMIDQLVNITNEPLKSKNPLVIAGFPGMGLVGNIACQHIIEEFKMEHIGSIDSRFFPPLAMLFNGIIATPIRIYESSKNNLIVIISDIPIHPSISYDFTKALVEWIQTTSPKNILSIAGMATNSGDRHVFGGATNSQMLEKIKNEITIFNFGTISGFPGSIMIECYLRNINAVCLMGETHGPNPDPRTAVEVIKVINKTFGLSIQTETLTDQAEQIEIELSKLAEQVKTTETYPQQEFPMYG